MMRFRFIFSCLIALLGVQIFTPPLHAQTTQCGITQSIRFPVDPNNFSVTQAFGAPSPRHQGRYHTGEDFYGGRGTSLGQPIQAIGLGRVTFSSPNGWGRDGGVIIIEHTFPDGTVAYSQYGHIAESNDVRFPAVFSCVNEGDVIAVVGDARPAPHLHFEIRVNNPDIPGAGYTWEDPHLLGYREPTKFLLNWQTRLAQGFAWSIDLAETAPPPALVKLSDNGLVYLDGGRVYRASSDGRVLWRAILNKTAVGVFPYTDSVAVAYADGTFQHINPDGTLGESWGIGVPFDAPPIFLRNVGLMLLHSPENALIAFDTGGHNVLWRAENVAPIARYVAGVDTLVIITHTKQFLTFSYVGELLHSAIVREPSGLFADPTGGILAYTRGGLWEIDSAGAWSLVADMPTQRDAAGMPISGGESAAIWREPDGGLYVFDGAILTAYDIQGMQRWQVNLPNMRGEVQITSTGDFLLLTSSYGHIVAIRTYEGAVCNMGQVFGDGRSHLWHDIGADGIVRLFVADQILGLNWQRFRLGCG